MRYSRILVFAADQVLAGKMVRNVKRIIERHPLCKGMKPKQADQWASDRFTVRRPIELRDPSMLARGISANLTGSRADLVICDDVEVPNTCDSVDKRAELRERLAEISYVLVPGGTRLYIGTPHHYYSIYARGARKEIGEERAFLDGFNRLEIPALDQDGHSAWPERFSEAYLRSMKLQTGPAKFNSQMMLRPTNIAEGRLNPDLLRYYDGEVSYVRELNRLELADKVMARASAFWDPAFGSAKGDHSVLAIIYSDDAGLRYLQHIEYIKIKPYSAQDSDSVDEATQQCRIVADLAKKFHLPSITVETNGIGRFLLGLLRKSLHAVRAPTSVQEVSRSTNKEARILEAFDAPLAAQRLFVNEAVKQTPFIAEMREWRPDRNRGHDDGLDAVAGALAQEADHLPSAPRKGAHSWMRGGASSHQAQTDFTV